MAAKGEVPPDFSLDFGGLSLGDVKKREKPSKSPSANLKIVYFDVQSTGFSGGAEVIQLAARYQDRSYSDYIMPKKEIPDEVTDLTGLFKWRSMMVNSYNNCEPVPAEDKQTAVNNFFAFLKSVGEEVILVAHNCLHYDAPMLSGLMYEVDKVGDFKKLVFGFSEVLGLFRKKLKGRRDEKHGFKLEKLAGHFLHEKNKTLNSVVHVKWLQGLVKHPRINISDDELINHHIPAEGVVNEATERKWKYALRKDVELLKVTVSDTHGFVGLDNEIIDRFVGQGIGLHDLYSYWKHGGEDYVRMIITTPMEGQPDSVIAQNDQEEQMIMDNLAVVFKHGLQSILAIAEIARDHPFVTEGL
ncbi:uncharacterized protein LOC135170470 [Diachasmimorpha longicaudata]|uniref:uncharacterized protein LOC135170470 n=1 Tax=Diachasmimorpha longicaudata TaxID=58733 RepID=UPI0030B8BBC1